MAASHDKPGMSYTAVAKEDLRRSGYGVPDSYDDDVEAKQGDIPPQNKARRMRVRNKRKRR